MTLSDMILIDWVIRLIILFAPSVFDSRRTTTGTISPQTLLIAQTAGRGKLLSTSECSEIVKQLARGVCTWWILPKKWVGMSVPSTGLLQTLTRHRLTQRDCARSGKNYESQFH